MSAAVTDKFKKTYNSANPNVARVTSTRTAGGTSLACDNLAGWPTDTGVAFITYKIDTNSKVIAGTQIDWVGVVSGNNIGTLTRVTGATDAGSSIGDVVEMTSTGSWANDVIAGILTQHNQDGTHSAITGTSISTTGNASFGGTLATTGNATITGTNSDRGQTLETIRSEQTFDFVASGLVWSGDSYGSTRAASMTSGVVYIGGRRFAISAVTARSFTASKDTYIDISTAGALVYTEVTNNAASPALTSGYVRLGIIVTGASNIANAGSVNQGQEYKVLPIASSVPYAVTDSLGNLICPRDPQRRILCYRQILSSAIQTATSPTQISGLSASVIVPAGRKIRITVTSGVVTNSGANATVVSLWDGAVGAGTQLTQGNLDGSSGTSVSTYLQVVSTPSSTSKTYNAGLHTTAGTATFVATSTIPAYLMVELV